MREKTSMVIDLHHRCEEEFLLQPGHLGFFKEKILAVVGTRRYDNYKHIKEWLDCLKPVKIISGGAKGVDSLAEQYANEKNIEKDIRRPQLTKWPYKRFGAKAYVVRNQEIVDRCEAVLAFVPIDSDSKGTEMTLGMARNKNIPIIAVRVEVEE